MQEIAQFFKALGALAVGILFVLVIALVVVFTVANPWVIGIALVAIAILAVWGFVLVVHVIHDQIDARRHAARMRRLEAEAREEEIAGQRIERTRRVNSEAEQFRLQQMREDLVKLRPGEILMQRQGNDYVPVYAPPPALPPGRFVSSDLVEEDEMPELQPARPVPVPDALTVIRSGRLPKGDVVMLGFNAAREVVAYRLAIIRSVMILGLQRGGKTNTGVWLVVQWLVKGARLALIDKHAHGKDDSFWNRIKPLAFCFEVPLGDNPQSALRAADHALRVLKGRLAGRFPCSYPFVFTVDEYTMTLRDKDWSEVADKVQEVLEHYNTEGAGVRCFAVCIGHSTNASRTGGTEVRDLFATRLVHAMRGKQAQNLDLTEYKREIERLPVGTVLADTEEEEPFPVAVPEVTSEAIAEIARVLRPRSQELLQQVQRSQALQRQSQVFSEEDEEPDTERLRGYRGVQERGTGPFEGRAHRGAEGVRTGEFNPINAQPLHPRAHRDSHGLAEQRRTPQSSRLVDPVKRAKVLELLRYEPTMGKHRIVPEVWGISKGGSAAYKQACLEFDQVVRSLIETGELQA